MFTDSPQLESLRVRLPPSVRQESTRRSRPGYGLSRNGGQNREHERLRFSRASSGDYDAGLTWRDTARQHVHLMSIGIEEAASLETRYIPDPAGKKTREGEFHERLPSQHRQPF